MTPQTHLYVVLELERSESQRDSDSQRRVVEPGVDGCMDGPEGMPGVSCCCHNVSSIYIDSKAH